MYFTVYKIYSNLANHSITYQITNYIELSFLNNINDNSIQVTYCYGKCETCKIPLLFFVNKQHILYIFFIHNVIHDRKYIFYKILKRKWNLSPFPPFSFSKLTMFINLYKKKVKRLFSPLLKCIVYCTGLMHLVFKLLI